MKKNKFINSMNFDFFLPQKIGTWSPATWITNYPFLSYFDYILTYKLQSYWGPILYTVPMSEPPRLPSTLKHKSDEASGRCQWAVPVEADSVVTLTVPQGLRLCGRGAAAWKIMREWANATKPILAFLALPWFPECQRRSRRKWLTMGQKCKSYY